MSYGSRTQYPRTGRTARGRGRGSAPSYTPHVMNNPTMDEEEEAAGYGEDDSYRTGQGRRGSTGGSTGGRGERRMQR